MRSRTPKPLDSNALMTYAARLLSARALSVSELREKLRRRAAEPADVDAVLGRLKESGYLDDRKFAQSFASWRRENQGFGKSRVMRDLLTRRVPSAVAAQAAETAFQGSDEVELIEKFLERKYRGKDLGALLAEEKHLASAYRKLRLGGFSAGNSIRVLKRFAADAERLEGLEE